jgi:hypothetical protein
MSEDFDELLSGAVDSAANAAHKPGAAAARKRGGQRRTRQRLAASTLAIALLGGVGSVAAVSLGHTARTPVVSATGTASLPPSPTGSASTSPSPSLSSTPSTSSSPTGSPSSTSTSSGTTGTTGPTGSTSATETWLTASQVPFDSAMNWIAGSPSSCAGTELVFMPYYAGGCSEHTDAGAPHPATKMDTLIYSSTGAPTGDGAWIAPAAAQTFYTYPSAADAQSAYEYYTQSIRDEDAQFKGGTAINTGLPLVSTTTVTAQTADAMAIDHTLRDSHGTPAQVDGNPGGYSDVHFFLAVKGDMLEVLQISGGPSVSVTSQDSSTLATVVNALG